MSALPVAGRPPQSLPVVLIVEDHQDSRVMYAEFLGDIYEVLQAGDGAEALELMRTHRPDIVITDLSLPGMDGFELVATMRKSPDLASIPTLCLSGYGGHEHGVRAREAGCDLVLQKPCLPEDLARAAAGLLSGRGAPL